MHDVGSGSAVFPRHLAERRFRCRRVVSAKSCGAISICVRSSFVQLVHENYI